MAMRSLAVLVPFLCFGLVHCSGTTADVVNPVGNGGVSGSESEDGVSVTITGAPAPTPPGKPAAGCVAKPEPDVPNDDAVDSNCDGISGDVSAAIFVAPGGDEAGDGSVLHPVRTMGHALDLAKSAHKAVYACIGGYVEAVTVVDAVSVYGGYDCANGWRRGAGTATIESPTPTALTVTGSIDVLFDHVSFRSADATTPGGSSIAVRIAGANVKLRKGAVLAGKGGNGVAIVPAGAPGGAVACDGRNDCSNGGGGFQDIAPRQGPPGTFAASGFTPGNGASGVPGGSGQNGVAAPTGTVSFGTCTQAGASGECVQDYPDTGVATSTVGMCGCGGAGGSAGRGGGGGGVSVGVLSSGSGTAVVLEAMTVTSAKGGDGLSGTAGAGGAAGSTPMVGASSSQARSRCVTITISPRGNGEYRHECRTGTQLTVAGTIGGAGGTGGAGGPGGSGAGGPSYGTVSLDGSNLTSDVTPTPGNGGAGGAGAPAGDAAASKSL